MDSHHWSQDVEKKCVTKASTSPLETKAAMQELLRYDGRQGREMWRKKVTYYLHSKNPDMACLLRRAELEEDIITAEGLRKAKLGDPILGHLQRDPEVLSYNFCGYLNVSFVEEAWMILDATEIENSFKVGGP